MNMKKQIIIGISVGVALLAAIIGGIVAIGKGKATKAEPIPAPEKAAAVDIYDDDEEEMDPEFGTDYGSILTGSEWGNNWEGSATFLRNKNLIVTVAVDTTEHPFAEGDLAAMRDRGQKAVDFIVEQGKQYGVDVDLVYNQDDLNYSFSYDGEDVADIEFDDYDDLMARLCRKVIPVNELREKYGAEGIGLLFLCNGTGESFATAHLVEDETAYFYEGAFLFLRDYDYYGDEIECGPAAYAHHLLTLFGAVELEVPDASNGYTTDLCNAVHEKYLDDIMYTSLDKTGQMSLDTIDKKITPITAYTVDFTDTFDELAANPEFTKTYIASFTDRFMENTNNNTDLSRYAWNSAWDDDAYYSDLVEEDLDISYDAVDSLGDEPEGWDDGEYEFDDDDNDEDDEDDDDDFYDDRMDDTGLIWDADIEVDYSGN